MNGVTVFRKDFALNCSAVAKPFFVKSRLSSGEIIPRVAYD